MRFIKILFSVLFVITVALTVVIKLSNNTDYSAPEIVCKSDTVTASVNDGDEKLLSYITAHDEKDGDLTDDVIVESISPFIGQNSAKITYAVCDSDNNVTKLTCDIVYEDYKAPEFKFDKQQVYYVGASRVDLLSGVSAFDSLDGDVSSRIVISSSEIDLSLPGIYPVTYRVTTSKGVTSEITVNVFVYSSRLQNTISLKSYLVYTDSDNPVNPETYIESVPEEYIGARNYSFDIIDEVDYTKPGVYYITYGLSYTDYNDDPSDDQILAEAYLAVAVRGDS